MTVKIASCLVAIAAAIGMPNSGIGRTSTTSASAPPADFSGVWQRGLGRMGAVKNLSARPDVVIGDY